jgi:homoserine dehydrogenase
MIAQHNNTERGGCAQVVREAARESASAPAQHPARVALLGCGTVGSEVARHLAEHGRELGVELVSVLVRDASRQRGVASQLITTSADELFAARPELVIEVIGGVEPAAVLVARALRRGIHVVTANKTLIAHRGPRLQRLAQRSGAKLALEASVCAGVPILAALRQLRGDRILGIQAVVNGTCNFILSRMESTGVTFAAALAEAQRLGLAEADPSADVSGRDSAEKLCILARAAGVHAAQRLRPCDVVCEGIEKVAPADLAEARQARRVVRLIAELDAAGRLRVGPALVARNHPLAQTQGAENVVVIRADLAGEIVLRGPGAGPRPTASAILGDVARLLGRRSRALRPSTSGSPGESHQVRISSAGADPQHIFDAVNGEGCGAREVSLARGRASVLAQMDHAGAQRCAARLTARGGEALVMRLIE